MMSIKEIKALLDEGKIVVLYKDEDGYAVTEFPPRTATDGGKKNIISDDGHKRTSKISGRISNLWERKKGI